MIRGARQHNLDNLDVSIPLGQLTVVTGVSGSGKSSLAFDTLYAEGQRRYVESFSVYARQFLERMDRPNVDEVEGVLPAVAIDQKNHIRSARSTVGTMTEISDYLKLLYGAAGILHCEGCDQPVKAESPLYAAELLLKRCPDERAIVGFYVEPEQMGGVEVAQAYLQSRGYFRVLDANHSMVRLDDSTQSMVLDADTIVIQDRITLRESSKPRLVEALEHAMREGSNSAVVAVGREQIVFSNLLQCADCNIDYKKPSPALFSFNTPVGACPACNGFGRVIGVDIDRVIPNSRLTLAAGAVQPWTTKSVRRQRRRLLNYCESAGIPTDVAWRDLDEHHRAQIVEGDRSARWSGIKGWFQKLQRKTYKMHVRIFLARYRGYFPCDDCGGHRYRKEALRWRVGGLNLAEVSGLSLSNAMDHISTLDLSAMVDESVAVVRSEILSRLGYLVEVGLSYLTLSRQSRTLSGGEVQRVNLTTALGSKLVGTLYVLDEPSVGLHARDNNRLLAILRSIRDLGNTVVVVEHDEAVIRSADHLIDMGPYAGEKGGKVMFQGTPLSLASAHESLTAQWLGKKPEPLPSVSTKGKPVLRVEGAAGNNLQSVDVSFVVGAFNCVTGVSGSGKSTLVVDTLYRGLLRERGIICDQPAPCEAIIGADRFEQVVLVDASPVATSPRSNPATYLKAWDFIRKLFAKQLEAERRGFTAGTFSFNSGHGRCDVCDGSGYERVEMQFLSDLFITCEACQGTRFKSEVLSVKYRGSTIDQILQMTANTAVEFFEDNKSIVRALKPLVQVGLGYLRLGQPLSTLSGGEAQRLKLAHGLKQVSKGVGEALYILDEPTTGLHLHDVDTLCSNLRQLADPGHTVVVIEHHLDLIRQADHIVDLGPEGGAGGGTVVVSGSPRVIAKHKTSHTSQWLRSPAEPPCPAPPSMERTQSIDVRGARVHNLKDLDVSIPHGQMTVITGPSGSGKSSLAFDVLFAEGQRRFIDCLSPYARQYIPQASRPDLDELTGIPATVAIEQRTTRFSSRSTVGTVTEIHHFLRLLFARLGRQHCHVCGQVVQGLTTAEIVDRIAENHRGNPISVLGPIIRGRKGWHKEVIARAEKIAVLGLRIDGRLYPTNDTPSLGRYEEHHIEYLTLENHLVETSNGHSDLSSAVEIALDEGHGTCYVMDHESGEETIYSLELFCSNCSIGFERPDPRLFSFHGRGSGACRTCDGMGQVGEESPETCTACAGSRLGKISRCVLIGDCGIQDVHRMTAGAVNHWLETLSWDERETQIAEPIVSQLSERCQFLERVGLGYLSLDRSGPTLSGGEAQRVRLAAQLAAQLSGVLYVLDEPTIGLHPRDNDLVLDAFDELRKNGNTLVVVEHDQATIDRADVVIDMGPGGGQTGGEIVAMGSPKTIRKHSKSLTGQWLDAWQGEAFPVRKSPEQFIELSDAERHNLKDLCVKIPRGRMTVVTGVSGSGKTTLVRHELQQRLKRVSSGQAAPGLTGADGLKRIIEINQNPIGRTPRSVPATYVGIMDDIRKLFAKLPDAQIRGYSAARFSFNVKGGRCDACKGQGSLNVEMAFLPNVYVPCETCQGRRYNDETLRVTFRSHTIADVLQSTVADALAVFESQPRIKGALELMADLGLGYLKLGQASNTLSGGEAQRIKLVSELRKRSLGNCLYILDEPSTGLHRADLARLLSVFNRFVDRGDTLIVIEHNLDVIAAGDWIVDLGPEGGANGGNLVYQGTVPDLLKCAPLPGHTARYLAEHLA